MLEQVILGIIQGIAEWLPVSSEGLIVLAKTHLFSNSSGIDLKIQEALFLHLGTVLAALIYFRKDVSLILKTILRYHEANPEVKKILSFLCVATLVSGLLGMTLLKALTLFADSFASSAKLITLIIGFCLLGTAYLELKTHKSDYRKCNDLRLQDGILLGITQGFAVLPGLSRSGLTVSMLLLNKFDKTQALRLSFLMSIPIVLAGNVILNMKSLIFSAGEPAPPLAGQAGLAGLVGLFFSFIFGIATIHLLLKVAQKVNFGYFVLAFGILTILSVLL